MSNTVVVLVNYNGARDTAQCVKSLHLSSKRPAIVVVDNTPNDPILESAISSYTDVHIIRSSENLGFGRGNNLGIRWALAKNYPYIFILNNDTQVKPDTIQNLEEAIDKLGVGIVAPRIVFSENPDVLWYGGGDIDWRRGGAVVPGIFRPANSSDAMCQREVSFVSGCAMFVKRDVFKRIGGFDPRFFMYEEDLELCLRAKENQIKLVYIPNALVLHKGQGSLRELGEEFISIWDPQNPRLSFYVFHIVRNRLLNMGIHAKGKNLVKFIFGFPILVGWKALLFLKSGSLVGIQSIFRGFSSYLGVRKIKFVDEIKTDSIVEHK